MMSCHQATRLMSEYRERSLSVKECMALRFHTMICAGCRRFDEQLDFLGRASRAYTKRPDSDRPKDDHNNQHG